MDLRRRSAALLGLAVAMTLVAALLPETQLSTAASAARVTHLPCAGSCLLRASGTGNATLKRVSLPKAWKLAWSFSCPSASRFAIRLYASSRSAHRHAAFTLSRTARSKKGSTSVQVAKAGKYTVSVTTACAWTLKGRAMAATPTALPTATPTPTDTPTPTAISTPTSTPTNTPTPTDTPLPTPTPTTPPRFVAGTTNSSDGSALRFAFLADRATGIEALVQIGWPDGTPLRRMYTDGFGNHPPKGSCYILVAVTERNFDGSHAFKAVPIDFELQAFSYRYAWRPGDPKNGFPIKEIDHKGDEARGIVEFQVPDIPMQYSVMWTEHATTPWKPVWTFTVK